MENQKKEIDMNFKESETVFKSIKDISNMIDWDNDWKFKQPKLNRKERRKLSKKKSIKKNPIRLIESKGYKFLKDDNGNLLVGVDRSYNDFKEGCNLKFFNDGSKEFNPKINVREEIIEDYKIISVNINKIKDYNSLWEITKSGWNSEDELIFPYVNLIDIGWVRWDNQQLRNLGNIYHWDRENTLKYFESLMDGKPQLPMFLYPTKNGKHQKL